LEIVSPKKSKDSLAVFQENFDSESNASRSKTVIAEAKPKE
jgi:hypothetical protein